MKPGISAKLLQQICPEKIFFTRDKILVGLTTSSVFRECDTRYEILLAATCVIPTDRSSHLVMSGVDLTAVRELLGHKTLTMTLRYAHLAPSHKVKAVEVSDSTLNGKPTVQRNINLGLQQEATA